MSTGLSILIINFPTSSGTAPVQPMPGSDTGVLCSATGNATGNQITEILALCEKLPSASSNPTLTPMLVRGNPNSVTVGTTAGDWSGQRIPTAWCANAGQPDKWNALSVCSFFSNGTPATQETVKFKGNCGTCSSLTPFGGAESASILQLLGGRRPGGNRPESGEQREDKKRGEDDDGGNAHRAGSPSPQAGGTGIPPLDHALELADFFWYRYIHNRHLLREPVDRDGDWLLYRELPVDEVLGAVLGLDGKPLRAKMLSLSVERITLRRKINPPFVHLGTPYGTGETAINNKNGNSLVWRFEHYPCFGAVVHQNPLFQITETPQLLTSTSRESPNNVFVNPQLPVRVAINSPRTEDYMNEGSLDVWVRVNAR